MNKIPYNTTVENFALTSDNSMYTFNEEEAYHISIMALLKAKSCEFNIPYSFFTNTAESYVSSSGVPNKEESFVQFPLFKRLTTEDGYTSINRAGYSLLLKLINTINLETLEKDLFKNKIIDVDNNTSIIISSIFLEINDGEYEIKVVVNMNTAARYIGVYSINNEKVKCKSFINALAEYLEI